MIVNVNNRFSPRVAASNIGLYPLTRKQLTDFSFDLWTDTFIEKIVHMVVGDPSDAILGLRWYYGLNSYLNRVPTDTYVKVGNVAFDGSWGTTQSRLITRPLGSEYVTVSMGEVKLPGKDDTRYYAPEMSIEVYIPFVGYVNIDPADVYPDNNVSSTSSLRLDYNINVMSGMGLALLYRSRRNPVSPDTTWDLILEMPCEVGVEVPFTIQAMESALSRTATMLAGSASMGLGAMVSASNPVMTPLAMGAASGAMSKFGQQNQNQSGMVGQNMNHEDFLNTASAMASSSIPSVNIKRSGGMSGESSSLSSMRPKVVVTRHYQTWGYNDDLIGSPDIRTGAVKEFSEEYGTEKPLSGEFIKASKVSGFNRKLFSGPSPTRTALAEIESMLLGGVYID